MVGWVRLVISDPPLHKIKISTKIISTRVYIYIYGDSGAAGLYMGYIYSHPCKDHYRAYLEMAAPG